MVRAVLTFFVFGLTFTASGQTKITFRLDARPLLGRGLCLPESGDKLLVRGDFNHWSGNAHELVRTDGDSTFSGRFTINADIGDTLEYKFVLAYSTSQIVWERNPNPINEKHGNRSVVVTDSSLVLPLAVFDHDEYIQFPIIFKKTKLQEDFLQLRQAVESNHPALYDYTSKERLDSLFEYSGEQIDRDLEFSEFYRILAPVLSSIGCGHTKLWIPADYWNIAPRRFFPLRLLFSADKVLVSGRYSPTCNIPIGSEILSLNGHPILEIITTLKSITSSDGHIEAFKSRIVEKHFSKRYALYYGYPSSFTVEYVAPGEGTEKTELSPVGIGMINSHPVRGSELSLRFLDDTADAIITINTFIYYDQLEMFRSFIDSTFRVVQERGTSDLIIDLRGNDGGDPFCASYLLSYVAPTAVPYFEEPYGKYADLAEPIPVALNSCKGRLYVLIDGGIFSTTGHLCSLLKYHKIGKLVGSETGATFTCTGNVRYVDLENTRLILGTARERKYNAAVQNMDRTKGIEPDYRVEQSQNDLVEGRDSVFDFVVDLVRSSKSSSHQDPLLSDTHSGDTGVE